MFWKRLVKRAAVAVAILAGLCVAVAGIHFLRAKRAFDAHISEIRAAGGPTTMAEIDALYTMPPEGENAAPIYAEAFGQYKTYVIPPEFADRAWALEPPLQPSELTEAEAAHFHDWLTRNDETIGLLHQAAQYTQCRYPIDLTEGYLVQTQHYTAIHHCGDLLLTHAHFRADASDSAAAWESAGAAMALAHSVANEPVLISQSVRNSLHTKAREAIFRLFETTPLPPAYGAELLDHLETVPTSGLVAAFDAERVHAIKVLAKRPGDLVRTPDVPFKPVRKWILLPLYTGTGVQYIDLLEVSEVLWEVRESIREGSAPAYQGARRRSVFLPASTVILDNVLGLGGSHALGFELDLALIRTALALALHLQELSVPESLEDLVGPYLDAIPMDPLTGQKFLYHYDEQYLYLYSPGVNGIDQSGPAEWGQGSVDSDDQGIRIRISRPQGINRDGLSGLRNTSGFNFDARNLVAG